MTDERKDLLIKLCELKAPLEMTLGALSVLGWDIEEELVTLEPHHVESVMQRFLDREMSADVVEDWANALEGRDDVALADKGKGVFGEVLFELANPTLHGQLTKDVARLLISRLRQAEPKTRQGDS